MTLVQLGLPAPGAPLSFPRPAAAAAVGVFDGFHRGHQKVIADLHAFARERGGPTAVVTFEQHPQEILTGRAVPRLSSLDQRLLAFTRAEVDFVLVLRFDRQVASWSPDEFVRRVLSGALGCRGLFLGDDDALGKDRKGTLEYFQTRAADLGIEVRSGEPLLSGDERISSTRVRDALRAGDLTGVRELLGRPYAVLGSVVRGDGRGRPIGFPTANIETQGVLLPQPGVYIAEARVLPDQSFQWGSAAEVKLGTASSVPALVNLGRRPTFQAANPSGTAPELTFEAHLLDFEGDLYGRRLEVELLQYLRPEKKFPGIDALKAQIGRDVDVLRERRSSVANAPAK